MLVLPTRGRFGLTQRRRSLSAFEWRRLSEKGVWDEAHPRAWNGVRREANASGKPVHMGFMFDFCVEKNSEMAPEKRKYKGRAVFQGNAVVDQNYGVAIFQDLGSQPATMEAPKAADFYGCVPGHALHVADAEQAYVQAPMKGTPTWVAIPP